MSALLEQIERAQRWRRIRRRLGVVVLVLIVAIAGIATYILLSPDGVSDVAVIRIDGEVVTGDFSGGGYVGSEYIGREVRAAADDPLTRAIVLRIDSPGGSPAGAQEIVRDLEYARTRKPVVTSMGDLAASAGYLIAAHTDRIYLSPDTITGSIGVIWLFPDESEWMETEGKRVEVVKSGDQKDITSPYRPLTDDERLYVQALVDESFEDFLADVIEQRPVERAQIENARLIRGEEAVRIGLADEYGNLFDAIEGARNLSS
ncbi:signal peptide peptidase SppA [Methanofollis fontis]|uniref:Signal peptide peptidase SppA n=1 Tax=Methanofollis fontis TaxID=2052832 RepID=A0A483CY57_9EURY|nr:signal peptide peptidase SppA [Methanofollis fontis]TAJ44486.1 signal peptide peptidase SppA [Methanofollis fontis]